jgi:hypothetical protein
MGELKSRNQDSVKKWLDSPELCKLREAWKNSEERMKAEDQAWWDSLSMEERAKAFRQVVSLIYRSEVKDRGSYRHAMYNVFNIDYLDGLSCNYMELHNLIYQGLKAQADR